LFSVSLKLKALYGVHLNTEARRAQRDTEKIRMRETALAN